MKSERVEFHRRHAAPDDYFEIKDPSVVPAPEGGYYMYASNGISRTAPWIIGRFHADTPAGPWQELEPVTLTGIDGPEVVAPAVVLEEQDGKTVYKMYVQTKCFGADGVIAVATSDDGIHFTGAPAPALTKANVQEPVITLYDVALSDISINGKNYDCMTFSGYRDIPQGDAFLGCGDVYTSLREKGSDAWQPPRLALRQEDVPFHNRPGSANFEWGLEGAKVIQLAEDAYLMVGVCFLDKDKSERGTRQRVFFAAAASASGPFLPMGTPVDPTAYPDGTGENGHPDTIDLGDKIGLLYQERAGEGPDRPWHLRYGELDKAQLLQQVRAKLTPQNNVPRTTSHPATPKPRKFG